MENRSAVKKPKNTEKQKRRESEEKKRRLKQFTIH